jgi:hypothetical protein
MKLIKSLVASAALIASASAFATTVLPGNGSELSLQQVINNLYTAAGTPTSQAPDVNLNQASEDGTFQIEASGASVSTMVIELSGLASQTTFGIYDLSNSGNYICLLTIQIHLQKLVAHLAHSAARCSATTSALAGRPQLTTPKLRRTLAVETRWLHTVVMATLSNCRHALLAFGAHQATCLHGKIKLLPTAVTKTIKI